MTIKRMMAVAMICLLHQMLYAQIYGSFTDLEDSYTPYHLTKAANGDYFAKLGAKVSRISASGLTLWTFPEELQYVKIDEQESGEVNIIYVANFFSAAGSKLVKAQLSASGELMSSQEIAEVDINQPTGIRVDAEGNSYFLNRVGNVFTKLDPDFNAVWELELPDIENPIAPYAPFDYYSAPGFFLSASGKINLFSWRASEVSAESDELVRFQIDSDSGEITDSQTILSEEGTASVLLREDDRFSVFLMKQNERSLNGTIKDYSSSGDLLQESELQIESTLPKVVFAQTEGGFFTRGSLIDFEILPDGTEACLIELSIKPAESGPPGSYSTLTHTGQFLLKRTPEGQSFETEFLIELQKDFQFDATSLEHNSVGNIVIAGNREGATLFTVEGTVMDICDCGSEIESVCAENGISYPNACFAECLGLAYYLGTCSDDFSVSICEGDTLNLSLIASHFYSGADEEVTYIENGNWSIGPPAGVASLNGSNAILAPASTTTYYVRHQMNPLPPGATPITFGSFTVFVDADADCGMENPCNCPETEELVCGYSGTTYQNSCFADCAEEQYFEGPCEPEFTSNSCEGDIVSLQMPPFGPQGPCANGYNFTYTVEPQIGIVSGLLVSPTEPVFYTICRQHVTTTLPGQVCPAYEICTTHQVIPDANCSSEDCDCSILDFPVCADTGEIYESPCLALCAGVDSYEPVAHCEADETLEVCQGEEVTLTPPEIPEDCTGEIVSITVSGVDIPDQLEFEVGEPIIIVANYDANSFEVQLSFDGECEDISKTIYVRTKRFLSCYPDCINIGFEDELLACLEFSETQNSPATEYDWLNDLLGEQGCCTAAAAYAYQSGPYTYIYISAEESGSCGVGTLYNEAGQFYCNSSLSYDCLGLYGLSNGQLLWSCDGTTPEPEETNPDPASDYPWLGDRIDAETCCDTDQALLMSNGNYSYIYITSCDGSARLYTEAGQLYCTSPDPSYDCLSFYNLHMNTATILWSCADGSLPDPEEQEPETGSPWVQQIIASEDCCTANEVWSYDLNGYTFYYLLPSSNCGEYGTLFDSDGFLYCTSSEGYDCLSLYGLSPSDGSILHSCSGKDNPQTPNIVEESIELSVYPNPSNGIFHIECSQESEQAMLLVHDLRGQLIKELPLQNTSSVDLTDYPAGLYLFSISTANQLITERVLLQ